jgi:hypoxanthine phosphoribosyltransferase
MTIDKYDLRNREPAGAGLRKYISQAEITARISEMAQELAVDHQGYKGKPIVAICLLNGALPFYDQLLSNEHLQNIDIQRAYTKAESYVGSTSTGRVTFSPLRSSLSIYSPIVSVRHRNIWVIDDIIDTGLTSKTFTDELNKKGAKEVQTIALLSKPDRRKYGFKPTYLGFTIANRFVVGCGLDFNQKYRDLQDIYEIDPTGPLVNHG